MATYSSNGYLFGKMPYIPIIKMKNWDIKIPGNVYSTGGEGSNESSSTEGEDRKFLMEVLAVWYEMNPYTWGKLQAADSETVSNDDLKFLLDLTWNLSFYYPEDGMISSTIEARAAFRFEVTEFVIQGYSPVDAQKKARESIKAKKFESKEPLLVKITNMSAEEKKKSDEIPNASNGNVLPGQTTDEEKTPPATKRNGAWIFAGVLILILTAK